MGSPAGAWNPILTGVRSRPGRWVWRGMLALAAGAFPVALSQLESRFADEEFFARAGGGCPGLLLASALGAYWLVLRRTSWYLPVGHPPGPQSDGPGLPAPGLRGAERYSLGLPPQFLPARRSDLSGDFGRNPSLRPGPPDPQTYDGSDVFYRILARVEANPRKGPPEYGMLALGTVGPSLGRSIPGIASEGSGGGTLHRPGPQRQISPV